MKHLFIIIFLAGLLTACVTTKPKVIQFARVCIEPTDGIIIDDIDSPLLTDRKNLEIRELVIKTFRSEGFDRVYDKHLLEYDFLANNIKGITSEDDRYEIHRKLDIKYILVPTVLNMKEKDPMILQEKNTEDLSGARQPTGFRSFFEFELIETLTGKVVYQIAFEHPSYEFSRNTSDEYIMYYIESGYTKDLYNSTAAHTKYTIADCSCPKGKYLKKRKRLQKFGM